MNDVTINTIETTTGLSISDYIARTSGYTVMPHTKAGRAMLIDMAARTEDGTFDMKATLVCGTVVRRDRLTELTGYGSPYAVVEILEELEGIDPTHKVNFVETGYASAADGIRHIDKSQFKDMVGLVRVANVDQAAYDHAIQLFKTDSRFIVIKIPNEPGDMDTMVKYHIHNSETRAIIGEMFSFGTNRPQNSVGLIGYNAAELTEYFNLFK